MFTLDGSLSKGRSFTNDLARLMRRAYNAEAENVVRTLRVGNLQTAIRRLEASRVRDIPEAVLVGTAAGFHDTGTV
jgi:uncharacterized protein DUF4041